MRVLQAIVEDYVATAEPVGSRTIARRYGLGVSAATIRNEMADLEEQGYLEQPHASAGRIPSDKGYRYYVDFLMRVKPLPAEVLRRVQQVCEGKVQAMEVVLQQVARLLAEATGSLAILVGPQAGQMVFRHIDLVPVAAGRALLVAVGDVGLLGSGIIEVPPELTPAELSYVGQLLDRTLYGTTVRTLGASALRELETEMARYRRVLAEVMELLASLGREDGGERLYLVGLSFLLSQPEFSERDRLQLVVSVLEHEPLLKSLLGASGESGVVISIGEENALVETRELGMVLAPYRAGATSGRMAVLGPKRMDYGRAVGAVSDFERVLSDSLGIWGGG